MADVAADLAILVMIARVDAAVRDHESELKRSPESVAKVDKQLRVLQGTEEAAKARFEELKKGRREAETMLQDLETRVEKSKVRQSEVKTNHEYTAVLKEIETLTEEIDAQEVRMLELMDELETIEPTHAEDLAKMAAERGRLEAERKTLTDHEEALKADVEKLLSEKPGHLKQLSPPIQKRYQRLLERYRDVAAVKLTDEHCDGCGTQNPPQVAVEVRKNNQLLACQSCGRLLIHYDV